MSPHFGRCPCPDNLIQIETGPSLTNLVKEMRYTSYYMNNPGPILMQSMTNNSYDKIPLGGKISLQPHGFDHPNALGILPDIHPCGNSTEEKHCDSAPEEKVIENLKEEASNEESFNVCYIITGLLLLAIIIAIICKFA